MDVKVLHFTKNTDVYKKDNLKAHYVFQVCKKSLLQSHKKGDYHMTRNKSRTGFFNLKPFSLYIDSIDNK